MSIKYNSNHSISLNDASTLTNEYRRNLPRNPSGTAPQPIAFAFGKNDMIDLLNQSGAVGFRIYMGMTTAGQYTPVITAIDADGNDMYEGNLMDFGVPCPADCSSANPLNQ